jgi:hypothetical protein
MENLMKVDYKFVFAVIAGVWTAITFLIGRRSEDVKTLREYNNELRKWADIVVEQMTMARLLCDVDPERDNEFYNKRQSLLIQLSSLADRGRFFLPNKGTDKNGKHKPSAYRGFRSEAIDSIVSCYDLVRGLDYIDYRKNKEMSKSIVDTKRAFVSAIQDRLDPGKFEKEVRKTY